MHIYLRYTAAVFSVLLASACSDDSSTASTGTGGTASTTGAGGDAATTGTGGASTTTTGTGTPSECASLTTNIERVVCAADAFTATLTSAEQASVLYDWTNSVAKTRWSNLPGANRNGLKFGSLTAASRAAAMVVADQMLSDAGYQDFVGVLAADDYLGTLSGSNPGGGGAQYSSDNYYIAFIGKPSTTGDWMLQIGGHHMAWNVTYRAGVGYPTPNHIGVEPKASFTVNGASYAPLKEEGDAIHAVFASLSAADLSSAYLTGQTFADVLLGPDEYETGSYANVVFPAGANRKGVAVSTLTAEQQKLVTTAIGQWVNDFDPAVADSLMTLYTSADAYKDTLVAWGGVEAKGVDVDVDTTYMRIDGPRVWIEVSCQAGVVVKGVTHYHSMFRDKTMDYGNSL
jgi:Protein of unknown function (DUF3500)